MRQTTRENYLGRLPSRGWAASLFVLLTTVILWGPRVSLLSAAEVGLFDPAQAGLRAEALAGAIIKEKEPKTGELEQTIKSLMQLQEQAENCVSASQAELDRIGRAIEVVGPVTEGESREVAQQRRSLQTKRSASEARLSECRLLNIRTEELLSETREIRRSILARALMHRRPHLGLLIHDGVDDHKQWQAALAKSVVKQGSFERLTPAALISFAAAGLIGFFLGWWLRAFLRRWLQAQQPLGRRFAAVRAGLFTIGHYGPYWGVLTGLILVAVAVFADGWPPPLPLLLLCGLGIFLLLLMVIRAVLDPIGPAPFLLPMPLPLSRKLAGRLRIFAAVLVVTGWHAIIRSEPTWPAAAADLTRVLLVTGLNLTIFGIVWPLGAWPELGRAGRWLRALSLIALMITLAAEWIGYRNFSAHLVRGTMLTLAGAALFKIVRALINQLFDGLAGGERGWQSKLRQRIGIREQEVVPSFILLRIISILVLWLLLGLFLLRTWGISATYFQQASRWLTDGFGIGGISISPLRILAGLVLFAMFWTLTRTVKASLDQRLLTRTDLGASSREAMITFAGYLGVTVAVAVGLGIAGMDFSRIAIIAGALSVGIGFGLQNIVNNFVSGLIILFEQPIKRGDWIVVGGTEGFVKRISVRSTVIRTFDHADVIVPNSEIISSQVVNWMLDDATGRVRIPVGVAYGSDTALVKKLLLEVALSHPAVVTDGSLPEPCVSFLSFGESSLDFELLCFIRNIDRRVVVRSDLNFAVDASFREHNIEIPFPQRDVHVRDWPSAPGRKEIGRASCRERV